MPAGILTMPQMAWYLKQAGFSPSDIPIMVAIAMAESSGSTQAHNAKPPDDSYGVWQINMIGNLAAPRRVLFGITKNDELYDPAVNARAALIIRRTQGFTAWSVFSDGSYKKFLSAAQQAAGAPQEPAGPNEYKAVASDPIQAFLDSIFSWVSEQSMRVALFVGGGLLIILGAWATVQGKTMKLAGALAKGVASK